MYHYEDETRGTKTLRQLSLGYTGAQVEGLWCVLGSTQALSQGALHSMTPGLISAEPLRPQIPGSQQTIAVQSKL